MATGCEHLSFSKPYKHLTYTVTQVHPRYAYRPASDNHQLFWLPLCSFWVPLIIRRLETGSHPVSRSIETPELEQCHDSGQSRGNGLTGNCGRYACGAMSVTLTQSEGGTESRSIQLTGRDKHLAIVCVDFTSLFHIFERGSVRRRGPGESFVGAFANGRPTRESSRIGTIRRDPVADLSRLSSSLFSLGSLTCRIVDILELKISIRRNVPLLHAE